MCTEQQGKIVFTLASILAVQCKIVFTQCKIVFTLASILAVQCLELPF